MDARGNAIATTVLIQVAGYAGAVAGLIATGALLAFSGTTDETLIFAIASLVTIALTGSGFVAGWDPGREFQRMAGVFWFAAVSAFGAAVQVLLVGVLGMGDDGGTNAAISSAVAGAMTAAFALTLWRRSRRSLQLISLYVALLGTLLAVVLSNSGPFNPPDPRVLAVAVWVFAIAWTAAGSAGAMEPRRTGLVLGTLTIALAPWILGSSPAEFGEGEILAAEVWATASGIGVLAFGALGEDRVVEGIGVVAVSVGASVLVADHLVDSESAAAGTLVVGIALLGIALVAVARRPRQSAPTNDLPPPPVA